MIKKLLGLGLALAITGAAAQSITPGGGGGGSSSVTGGSCGANQYTTAVGTNGAPTCAQPSASQVTGLSAVATTGSASSLTVGTLPNAQFGVAPTSWTPIDSSGAGLSLTLVSANYVRMGNMVFAYATVTYPGTADGSAMIIGGLPVTVANAGYAQQCTISWSNSSTLVRLRTIQGGTTIRGYTSAGVAVLNSAMSGLQLDFLCTYPAT